MPRMSDLSDYEELVARLEWLTMALAGSEDEEGLLALLDRLFVEGDAPSTSGLLPRIEMIYQHGERLLAHYAKIADVIEQPISDEQRDSIQQAIRDAIKTEKEALQSELADVQKAALLASERITESASKAEMSARSTQSELTGIESRLQQTVPAVAQQLKAMVSELDGVLSAEKLKVPLEASLKEVLAELSVGHQKEGLQRAWSEVLEGFGKSMAMDMQQHRESIETLLMESQQEQIERVKKIIDNRTPSDTIITLYDELDRTKARLAQYEDIEKAPKAPVSSKNTEKISGGVLWWVLAAGLLGAIGGGSGIWYYLTTTTG